MEYVYVDDDTQTRYTGTFFSDVGELYIVSFQTNLLSLRMDLKQSINLVIVTKGPQMHETAQWSFCPSEYNQKDPKTCKLPVLVSRLKNHYTLIILS